MKHDTQKGRTMIRLKHNQPFEIYSNNETIL